MKFGDKFIKTRKPKEGQIRPYDIREKSGDGFGLTVFPSGKKSFIFIYQFGGRKRRMTIGRYPHCDLATAKRIHREALTLLESGKDPALEKRMQEKETRDSSTIEGLIEEYLEKWAKPRKRSWKEDERMLYKDVKPLWGKRKATDITRREVIDLLDKIKERGAPILANRTLACIRRMFNFGIERDILPNSPCTVVKAVAKENRRDRCLTTDEIKNFWLSLDQIEIPEDSKLDVKMSEATKLALKLQLATAQRKGEIVSLEWSEIDTTTRWWSIPASKAKNGHPNRVYLSDLAMALLDRIKALSGDSKWAFPALGGASHVTPSSLSRALNRSTFERLEHFTPHDLRRSAATHMTSLGIPRLVVSKILNHVDSNITSIYDRHSYDAEKKHALEAWGKKLQQFINSGNSTDNVVDIDLGRRQKHY